MTRITTGILLSVLLSLLSLQALAQRKTDIVTLYNGDRITGEVKALDGGILKLSTDSMGTINIEWQEISTLESKYLYEVRMGPLPGSDRSKRAPWPVGGNRSRW